MNKSSTAEVSSSDQLGVIQQRHTCFTRPNPELRISGLLGCCERSYVISGAPCPVEIFVSGRMIVSVDLESEGTTCCSPRKDGRNKHASYEANHCSDHDVRGASRHPAICLACHCHREEERYAGRPHEERAPDIRKVILSSFLTETRLPECYELRRIRSPKSH